MNAPFIIGFLVGVGCGVVMGLAFAAMCFGVIAKVVIMAATYRHEFVPWKRGAGQKPSDAP